LTAEHTASAIPLIVPPTTAEAAASAAASVNFFAIKSFNATIELGPPNAQPAAVSKAITSNLHFSQLLASQIG
jgi:hypothetical protein